MKKPALNDDLSKRITEVKLDLELSRKLIQEQIALSQKAKKDTEYLKAEVIPILEHTLKLYELNKQETEEKIENMREELGLLRSSMKRVASEIMPKLVENCKHNCEPSDHSKITRKVLSSSPKAATRVRHEAVAKQRPKSSVSIIGKISSRTPRSKNYIPSYLRLRKSLNASTVKSPRQKSDN